MKTPCNLVPLAMLVALLGAAAAPAADVTLQAREILSRAQKSIITVNALNKLEMGGNNLSSQEASCTGLVIDASGLTVVSYSALNPMERLAAAVKVRRSASGGGSGEAVKVKADLSRIQMRLEDGTEVPALIVLKDKELDVAFLVPDPKEGDKVPPFTAVKMSSGGAVKELDEVVAISRHAKDLGYQPIVTMGQVASLITKPRKMYDLSVAPRPGSPVFLLNGQLLGVAITFGGESMSLSARETLVLPVLEITKLADQAREAAAKKSKEQKKKEDTKDSSARDTRPCRNSGSQPS